MFAPPVLTEAWLTAGVVFVMSALLETSVFGSGVGCARNAGANDVMKNARAAIDFMAPMLITRSGGLQTAVFCSRRPVGGVCLPRAIPALRTAKRLQARSRRRGPSLSIVHRAGPARSSPRFP